MTNTVVSNSQPIIDKAQIPAYRADQVRLREKAQEEYDKAVLTLSAGALGISFAFVKDIVGPGPVVSPFWLMTAWALWGLSSLCILISFYTSQRAFDQAIVQIDMGQSSYRPGGVAVKITNGLNAAGGILFVLGVGAIAIFVYFNLI